MINHFASLLGNLNLSSLESVEQKLTVTFGGGTGVYLNGATLGTGAVNTITQNKVQLELVDRNYTQITLPVVLQRVYNTLFPQEASLYYKHFLLYCYLRTVALTDRSEDIKKYDARITYVLEEMNDFFKFAKINKIDASSPDYNILVYGKAKNNPAIRNFTQSYSIQQILDTMTVLILSETQNTYLHPSLAPSKSSTNMAVSVAPSPSDPGISNPIAVGDTGLYFSIIGKISGGVDFRYTPNKSWKFSVDAPIEFSILNKVKALDNYSSAIDAMFEYEHGKCTQTYQNLWNMHYNPLYRLAGLLLGYVERANIVWQKLAT